MVALGAQELREMLAVATRCLEAKAAQIDELNVFPIPDGDTGTNMLLTMRSALRAAQAAGNSGIEETVEAIARGALLGARGNSGVILSQILVGMAQAVRGATAIGSPELGRAFRRGSTLAYEAVSEPVEGTMLTVIRETSEALRLLESTCDLPDFLEEALRAAGQALARTPEMLPELREAGVVDAGGQGLYTLLEGMSLYARGRRDEVPESALHLIPARLSTERAGVSVKPPGEAPTFPAYGFCLEFILDHGTGRAEEVTRELAALGSSLIVAGPRSGSGRLAGENTLVRVHVHCADPEELIRRAGALGSIEQVQIRDMNRQHTVYKRRRRDPQAPISPDIVAVAPGPGLAKVFLSLGAAVVTVGTRSPSAEELLDAVDSAPAAEIIVLPNHKNIVPVAEQARKLSAKRVNVIPTTNIAQGVAAMVAFGGELNGEVSRPRMLEAMAAVHSIEVCRAVRSTRLNGVKVGKNEHTAYLDGDLVAARSSAPEAVREALARLALNEAEIITLYYGAGIAEREARKLAVSLRTAYPHVSVEVVSGGQPLYAYLIGVE